MNIGSVSWELTVGASGGQPQVYTSLCLFKLKCLFKNFFLLFLTSHYSIHTVQNPRTATVSPTGMKTTERWQRFLH